MPSDFGCAGGVARMVLLDGYLVLFFPRSFSAPYLFGSLVRGPLVSRDADCMHDSWQPESGCACHGQTWLAPRAPPSCRPRDGHHSLHWSYRIDVSSACVHKTPPSRRSLTSTQQYMTYQSTYTPTHILCKSVPPQVNERVTQGRR